MQVRWFIELDKENQIVQFNLFQIVFSSIASVKIK